MDRLTAGKQVYTVRQVNGYIRQILDGDFILRNISVKGEISNCKYHSSGHIYFSLKDASAVISCVMFASAAAGLKIRLEDGKQVVVSGSVSIYEAGGKYQLYAKKIEEEGQGDLYRKFEALKEQLAESGYFAEEYKKQIPAYAWRIGVVTAETGAVIRDIFHVASRRNPYAQIYLYPAKVQGEGAAETICAGIQRLDDMGLDVIIIGRGGGSIEDLWAFNEESVAKAVFNCSTPIISAVGHETDFTIADFVADLRAPTPSAAAELAVFDYSRFEKDLADYRYTLSDSMRIKLRDLRQKTETYRLTIANLSPERQLREKQQRLADYRDRLEDMMTSRLERNRELLLQKKELAERLMSEKLSNRKQRLALVAERLEGLSPLLRLSQGYAYVTFHQKRLSSVSAVHVDDQIQVALSDGELVAAVTEIIEK